MQNQNKTKILSRVSLWRIIFFDALKMDEDLFAAFETEDTSSVLKKEKRGDTENTENTE